MFPIPTSLPWWPGPSMPDDNFLPLAFSSRRREGRREMGMGNGKEKGKGMDGKGDLKKKKF